MGTASYIVGYIEEAWPGLAAGGAPDQITKRKNAAATIARHNELTLNSLPLEDVYPPLCRNMFSWAPSDATMITYKNRLIHFAAAVKEIDSEIRTWLDKMEALLRTLYWESVFIRIQTAYVGTHEFSWRVATEWMIDTCNGDVRPITAWEFESTMPREELESLRE